MPIPILIIAGLAIQIIVMLIVVFAVRSIIRKAVKRKNMKEDDEKI